MISYFILPFLSHFVFSVETDNIVKIMIKEENELYKELHNVCPNRGDILLNNLFLYIHHLSQLTFLVKHEEPSFKQQAITLYTKSRPTILGMKLNLTRIKIIYDWRRYRIELMKNLLKKLDAIWNAFVQDVQDHIVWLNGDNKKEL